MSDPAHIYGAHLEGGIPTDISQHLPTLRRYAMGNVLEIGVRGGISTAALIMGVRDHGGHVYSVDVDDCRHYPDDPQWTFIRGHSVRDFALIRASIPEVLDVFFLDADHTYQNTLAELRQYAPMLRKDTGIGLLHDTDLQGAGVRDALETFRKEAHCGASYIEGCYGLGILAWGAKDVHDLDDKGERTT